MTWLKSYKKLKASSLLESVFAVAIIGIVMLIAMHTINRVLSSSYYNVDLMAQQKIKELWNETILEHDFNDNNYSFDRFTIKKEVQAYDLSNKGKLVFFTVELNNRKKTYRYFAKEKK